MAAGAKKVGYKECSTGHIAINSRPRDGRPATIQDGFCFQGIRSNAKWSTLNAEIPKGEATGNLEVRPQCQVLRIEHDKSGRVTGAVYADKQGNHHRQRARIVCVAGNSIETPRLLLNSASSLNPDGLANSSGQVGANSRYRKLIHFGRQPIHNQHSRKSDPDDCRARDSSSGLHC